MTDSCRDCKHFEMDAACADWSEDCHKFQYGECLVKLGDRVDIEVETGTWGSGGWVGEVTVEADFGCKSFEAKKEESDD